ncbi:Multidrug resistance-associated protein 1 [Boothiomyces macroporosus]|uniref:Multidrug resistance-associated protein 1 n=1 Tax=Boothiomyces macroporosus TaxID=261099 RepID=A0AAD5UL90_9FUNG|nr:Multidrug resistance-associated protein 1 [Boothiomyces macroporosus]
MEVEGEQEIEPDDIKMQQLEGSQEMLDTGSQSSSVGSLDSNEERPIEEEPPQRPKTKRKRKKTKFTLKPRNICSQFTFSWIIALVYKCTKTNDVRNLLLMLDKSETAEIVGNKLEKNWNENYVKGGVGDIVNLISIECNRIAEACVYLHYLWSAAFECIVLLLLAYYNIGVAAFAPLALVIFILFPAEFYLAVKSSSSACKLTALITKRVYLMSEILTAIKLIKFYTWEKYYREKVTAMRQQEIDEMRTELRLKISSFTIVFTAPAVAICVAMSVYHALGNGLTPHVVFTLLFLLNTLRYPLLFLPNAERSINGAQNSLKKLEQYFLLPEIDQPPVDASELDENVCMKIENGNFIWDGDLDHPHIVDLDLTLNRGEVVAIVGDIGSGKSLLAAIMGQLKKTSGTVTVNHAICGFVPQEPWFINATLRDNIMFGLELDEKKYIESIRIAGLTRDFMLLSNGDETFINDLNLSASQKQRLSLARCVYHDPDIILMEDCLGDFDATQAKTLFKESIKNQLAKSKCVVMLTQQKQFLPDFDRIIVMKAGKVVDEGTYKDLKAKNVNFSAWVTDVVQLDDDPGGLLENMNELKLDPQTSMTKPQLLSPLRSNGKPPHLQIRKKTMPRSSPLANSVMNADTNTSIKQIMELNSNSVQISQLNEQTISKMIERSQNSILTGNAMRPPTNFANQDLVSRTIEANHLTVHSLHDFDVGTLEPGEFNEDESAYMQFLKSKPGIYLGIFFLSIFLIAHGFRFFSDIWLITLTEHPDNFNHNMAVQWGLAGIIAFTILIRGTGFNYMILSKATLWHSKILESVLRAPMSFYDVTPLGHILSFFAKHLFSVDEVLPDSSLQVLSFLPIVLGTIIVACCYVPWLWATLPLYFAAWSAIVFFCMAIQYLFQDLETSNKSPMFAHLSTTLEGLFLIRLYHAQEKFDHFNCNLIDSDHKALYSLLLVKTLMAVSLDAVSTLFIYFCSLFSILFNVGPSETGLAISNALQLLLFVPLLVKMFFDFHESMSSVSSLIYFGDKVPRETKSKHSKIPEDWPKEGEIQFKNVSSKYQRYGVSVLKSVSFHILPKEKIAILGRSGSGKSTILMNLLRILEPSEGQILIDGIDTGKISLNQLRSRIAVIPQEPVMLSGTIRTNLDPFGACKDDEIWNALKMVHLGEKIMEMPDKLETVITENGRMFNISERQLFCIARAILIRTTIVVYDEPSVTVDRDTEHLIQQVMTENFSDCTLIVLATRFRVIVQMDRVMVMKHGEIVEFDTPIALLDNPKSKFSLMLSQTGDIDPAHLRKLAMKKLERTGSQPSILSSRASSKGSMVPRHLGELFLAPPISPPSSTRSLPIEDEVTSSTIVLLPNHATQADE